MLRDTLEAAIEYHPRMEERVFDVLVVKGYPGKLRKASSELIVADKLEKEYLIGNGLDTDWFRHRLEEVTGKPVIIDNAPPDKFQKEVKWNADRPKTFETALREQFGLRTEAPTAEMNSSGC